MRSPHLKPGNQKAGKPRALEWVCSLVYRWNGTSTWVQVHPGPTRTGNVEILATFCIWPSHNPVHTHFQKGSFHCFLPMVIQKITLSPFLLSCKQKHMYLLISNYFFFFFSTTRFLYVEEGTLL